jgi:preprotein translocase subunit SecA
MRMAEKSLLLQLLDQIWKDHLLSLDHLRQGINLRAYAQRDPLNEYKREAFGLFETMLVSLRQQVTSVLSHIELRVQQPAFAEIGAEPEEAMAEEMRATGTTGRPSAARPRAQRRPGLVNGNGADRNGADRGEPQRLAGPRAPWAGTPRNAPCPCGSGRKFKHCHGRV